MVKNTEINLSAIARDLKKAASDALVIGVGQGADGPVLLENPLTAKSAEALADSLKVLGITGAADQAVRLPGLPEAGAGVLVLAGVGKVGAGQPLTERGAAPRRRLRRPPAGRRSPPSRWRFPTADVADVAAVAEGAALGAYSFTEYRSSKDGLKDPVSNVGDLHRLGRRQGPAAGPEARRACSARQSTPPARWSTSRPATSTPSPSPMPPRNCPRACPSR